MKKINIYTDGACRGNPGPGGYGIIFEYGEHRREMSLGCKQTTNNRMELTAAIVALRTLKEPCEVTLYSDSKYLTDAINKGWIDNWVKNGWRKSDKSDVLNVDLWQELLFQMTIHRVEFVWVKGHASHPMNNRCDELATAAADRVAGKK